MLNSLKKQLNSLTVIETDYLINTITFNKLLPSTANCRQTIYTREYESITEAHAQLSVVGNCFRSSHRVCLGEGKQPAGGGGGQKVRRERESGEV
jgi:hypothetical protein